MRRILPLLAAASLLGCSEPELYLQYAEGPGDESHGEVRDVCWLTGPDETLALVELKKDPEFHPWSRDCTVVEPYVTSYATLDLKVVREANGSELSRSLSAVALSGPTDLGLVKNGDLALMSIRMSEGTAFVISIQAVASATSDEALPSSETELPTVWSTLSSEAADARDHHETRCAEQPGPGGVRRMEADEFDTWVRTPHETKVCDDSNAVVAEEPTGTVTDDH